MWTFPQANQAARLWDRSRQCKNRYGAQISENIKGKVWRASAKATGYPARTMMKGGVLMSTQFRARNLGGLRAKAPGYPRKGTIMKGGSSHAKQLRVGGDPTGLRRGHRAGRAEGVNDRTVGRNRSRRMELCFWQVFTELAADGYVVPPDEGRLLDRPVSVWGSWDRLLQTYDPGAQALPRAYLSAGPSTASRVGRSCVSRNRRLRLSYVAHLEPPAPGPEP